MSKNNTINTTMPVDPELGAVPLSLKMLASYAHSVQQNQIWTAIRGLPLHCQILILQKYGLFTNLYKISKQADYDRFLEEMVWCEDFRSCLSTPNLTRTCIMAQLYYKRVYVGIDLKYLCFKCFNIFKYQRYSHLKHIPVIIRQSMCILRVFDIISLAERMEDFNEKCDFCLKVLICPIFNFTTNSYIIENDTYKSLFKHFTSPVYRNRRKFTEEINIVQKIKYILGHDDAVQITFQEYIITHRESDS